MGAFQTLVTIIGLIGIVALLFLLFCRYLGGWTWTRTWLTSSREEKMVLTRTGATGHYNPNGYMIPSDSDLNLSGGGSFRRFDKTDNDYQLLRQGSASSLTMTRQPNIPPQPLRPAPLPPPSQTTNQFQSQDSVDSVFTAPSSPRPPPKIPPPPNQQGQSSTTRPMGTFPSLSSTNPFLPLIQASTQFFSQTLQTFQSFQPTLIQSQEPPSGYFQNPQEYYSNKNIATMAYPSHQSQDSTSGFGKMSTGELLFSTPPMYSSAPSQSNYQEDHLGRFSTALQIEPLSQLPVLARLTGMSESEPQTSTTFANSAASTLFTGVSVQSNPETDTLINMEPSPSLYSHSRQEMQSKSDEQNFLLETMRAEIRLENERMQDATKSLMMEEIGIPSRKSGPHLRSTSTENHSILPTSKEVIGNSGSGTARAGSDSSSVTYLDRPVQGMDRKFSAPEIGGYPRSTSGVYQATSNGGSSSTVTSSAAASASPSQSYRTRSFSLRQASVDSIGDMSDLASPDSTLPSLQRAMSCDSVCSDTSVVLGDLDALQITGQIYVGLEYDSETADLIVNVMEGKELVGLDPDPTAPFDSYVRVYLLPDKTTNMQTRVYRKSLSPVYKEKFMFGLEMTELPMRSLVFYLYATNKFSNTLIGEAELRLNEVDIKQSRNIWIPLTDTGQKVGELGEIIFSLSYLPTAERLTVVVVKARNLKFPHQRDTGDPFVKVYLLQRGKKVSKKKSSTKRAEKNPIFNEAMIFSVPTHALQTIQLRISVSDSSETEGRAYSIGHVIVGSVATGKPLSHWNQMLSSLRKPIAMWHSLRK